MLGKGVNLKEVLFFTRISSTLERLMGYKAPGFGEYLKRVLGRLLTGEAREKREGALFQGESMLGPVARLGSARDIHSHIAFCVFDDRVQPHLKSATT